MLNHIPEDYIEGQVKLYGFVWKCYYKFYTDEAIMLYCEMNNYKSLCYTHYKSLIVSEDL